MVDEKEKIIGGFIFIAILILLVYLFVASPNNPNRFKVSPRDVIDNHEIVVIDGCEYILYERNNGNRSRMGLTHKGNCSNTEHKIVNKIF